jgi:hypothetical protein
MTGCKVSLMILCLFRTYSCGIVRTKAVRMRSLVAAGESLLELKENTWELEQSGSSLEVPLTRQANQAQLKADLQLGKDPLRGGASVRTVLHEIARASTNFLQQLFVPVVSASDKESKSMFSWSVNSFVLRFWSP